MAIGRPTTRSLIDNEASDLVAAWDALAERTLAFRSKVALGLGETGLGGLPGGGYDTTPGTGAPDAPTESEAGWMVRMADYLGTPAQVYLGQVAVPEAFNFSDGVKAVRPLR